MGKSWTKEEEVKLTELVLSITPTKEIASILHRSSKSIQHKRIRLGLKILPSRFKSHEQYIKELYIANPDMECLEIYQGSRVPLLHRCKLCLIEYKSNPQSRLTGNKCNNCSHKDNSGDIPLDKPGIAYIVFIPKYSLYKLGITSKTVNERMLDNGISKYDSILERKFDLGISAINLEKVWKENLREYLVNTGKLKTGNTETFRIR